MDTLQERTRDTKMVFVLTGPAFQEDEGRYFLHGTFGSERQADKYIEDEVKKSKGWYKTESFIKAKKI